MCVRSKFRVHGKSGAGGRSAYICCLSFNATPTADFRRRVKSFERRNPISSPTRARVCPVQIGNPHFTLRHLTQHGPLAAHSPCIADFFVAEATGFADLQAGYHAAPVLTLDLS